MGPRTSKFEKAYIFLTISYEILDVYQDDFPSSSLVI